MLEQRGKCNRCGTHDWEWPDEGADSKLEADVYTCFGCEQVEQVADRFRDEKHQVPGRKIGLFRKDMP